MLNLFSEDVRRNPYPLYERMRADSPALRLPHANLWLLFDYQGVARALSDHESFGSSMLTTGRASPAWLIFSDPPRHTQLRALVVDAFAPEAVARREPRIRELSRQLLDAKIERGEMDLAADFSIPLPMMVIAELIGIPAEDWPRLRRWSDVILQLSYTLGEEVDAAKASDDFTVATAEMDAYLTRLLALRRDHPGDDLLSRFAGAAELSVDDILGFVQILLVVANETTTNLINNAILCLLENPEQLVQLRRSPELLTGAIDEVLRYRAPVQWLFRATRRTVEMHGQTIRAGSLVLPVIGSANRDPRAFDDPDRFDIMRQPNPHLGLGRGIHACLGAALAWLEARIALTDLLCRLKDLAALEETWQPRKALHVHGPNRLLVRFAPGPRAAA
jgi:cytochrome P450